MSREFRVPVVVTGENALIECAEKFKSFGKKAFIVTGKHVVKLDFFKLLTDTLESVNVEYYIFTDITSEPTDDMINLGLKEYKKSECDFFIGIGGGSPLDSIKAIATLYALGGNISDYMGKVIIADLPPMVAIPTTSGTGSEVTKFTIITDLKKDVKMLLKGDDLIPNLAIIDPLATLTCPKSITAATGLDALTHAVESFTSKQAQFLTDTVAISAVKRIFEFLPTAYNEPDNVNARMEMAIASLEAGIAINNASVTIVHGMSRPIGALFHVPHGVSNAMLLSKCMSFAIDGAYEKFAKLARAIGINEENDEKASIKFAQKLDSICKVCEIPTLEEYGVEKDLFLEKIDKMATDALISGSPQNTIKEVTKDDIVKIYMSLYN